MLLFSFIDLIKSFNSCTKCNMLYTLMGNSSIRGPVSKKRQLIHRSQSAAGPIREGCNFGYNASLALRSADTYTQLIQRLPVAHCHLVNYRSSSEPAVMSRPTRHNTLLGFLPGGLPLAPRSSCDYFVYPNHF